MPDLTALHASLAALLVLLPAARAGAAPDPSPRSVPAAEVAEHAPAGAAAASAALAATADSPAPRAAPAARCIAPDLPDRAAVAAYDAARADLRELAWADMAAFFEGAPEDAEPAPSNDPESAPAPLPLADAADALPAAARALLHDLAAHGHVDRQGDAHLRRLTRALARAPLAVVEPLLRAPSPTLRAYLWTWLAHSDAGLCLLPALDPALFAAALRDRSLAVDSAADLVFRPLADYALAARARLGDAPRPLAPDLADLLADGPPLARAAALGLLARRGDLDPAAHLHDPEPAVRLAAALAALDRRALPPRALVDLAAADPDDRVTEALVAGLLARARAARPTRKVSSDMSQETLTQDPLEALRAAASPRLRAALRRARGDHDAPARLPPPDAPRLDLPAGPGVPEPSTAPAPDDLPAIALL